MLLNELPPSRTLSVYPLKVYSYTGLIFRCVHLQCHCARPSDSQIKTNPLRIISFNNLNKQLKSFAFERP